MDRFSSFLKQRRKHLENVLLQVLPQSTEEQRTKIIEHLSAQKETEQAKAPRVAVIGQAGVGKSSTINALFGTELPVGHVSACTQQEMELHVSGQAVDGSKGSLIIYDMPGLGDDLRADREEYKELYTRILSECDVAIWVINAASRAMAYDQLMLTDVVANSQPELLGRLVIGLNQVDLMQPGAWNHQANVPSKPQRDTIQKRITYIIERFHEIVPGLDTARIVPYSAKQNYHLEQLFETLLHACPEERGWVLYSRKAVQDFKSMIDPELLEKIDSLNRR